MAEGGHGWSGDDTERDRNYSRLTDPSRQNHAKMKPKSKDEIESNLASLKRIVIRILKKHPGGINKSMVWNLVQKETKQALTPEEFGVSKMSKVFDKWSDTINSTGPNKEKINLRRDASNEENNSRNVFDVSFDESNFPSLSREPLPSKGSRAGTGVSLKDSKTDKPGYIHSVNENSQKTEVKPAASNSSLILTNPSKDAWKMPHTWGPVVSEVGTLPKDGRGISGREVPSDQKLASSATSEKSELKETGSMKGVSTVTTRVVKTAKRKSKKVTTGNEKDTITGFEFTSSNSQSAPTNEASSAGKLPFVEASPVKVEAPQNTLFGFQWTPYSQVKMPVVDPAVGIEIGDPSIIAGQYSMPAQNMADVMTRARFKNMDEVKMAGFTTKPDMQQETLTGTTAGNANHHPGKTASEEPRHKSDTWQDDIKTVTVKLTQGEEFETKKIDVRPVYVAKGKKPSKEQVNNVAKECIEILADANLFVTQERVEKLVCQRFGYHRIQDLGFRFVDQIECVNDLNRLICKINMYINAFVKTRSICTLHELKVALQEYAPDDSDFSSLRTGPLQRFPVVYNQFRFPPDQIEIPEITSMDILDHFSNYLTKNGLWTKKLELEPFMDYLVEKYNADNAYMLGVRIRSLALATTVLKKAQRDSASNRRSIKDHFEEELRNEIGEAFRKFRTSIMQTGDSEGMEIRKHYLKMKPELAIMEIFDKFNILHLVTQSDDRILKRATKFRKAIEDFLTCMRDNELGRNLLHLAVCMSHTAVEDAVREMMMPAHDERTEDTEKPLQQQPPPRKDVLLAHLKTYIERCVNAGALSLIHLDRIEEKLLEDFNFPAFSKMGYGRFLEFLLAETKQMLEEGGGLTLGSSSGGGGDSDMSFKPSQTDLIEFIKQFKQHENCKPEQIEEALCRQYGVSDVRHLGHGNISRLLSYAEKQGRHMYDDFTVFYESAFLRSIRVSSNSNSKVGILGHQTRDAAKFCLHSCPLLENMADWSQWSLVFEPELGKLKDFVQRYGGVTQKTVEGGKLVTLDFLALEIKPGELVKIVSTTSPDFVATALRNHDAVSTAGHLVSMAIAYKGVESMPIALLSGHVKTVLLELHAAEPIETNTGLLNDLHAAPMFVLQCLLRIPINFCLAFANQLFLDPLGQVVGSSRSKQILIQLCSSVEELNKMMKLGCLLGIQEWTDVIQRKCQPPASDVHISANEAEDFAEIENENQEDEDLVDEFDSEDVDEILAGEIDRKDTTNETNVEHEEDEDKEMKTSVEPTETEDTEKSTSEEVSEKPVISSCEDIVNQIRRDEFGVGVHLNEDGERLMKVQQERLGRSLDRLSKDLYSKDTHFVLELVQNADDNSYSENMLNNSSNECPSVKFVIEQDGIYVLNNELGFKEKDIRALCDVGRSTKGKHKFGYIGQKGIGFKSVFRITDAPEVHSNGYHIKFDVKSGPMGYILPHWVPEEERISQDDWMTHIILRLKTDMRLQTRTLAARFNDLHPSLLLFLHRLREITIENKVEHSVQTMKRRDVGESVIEIQHSDGCDRWLVIKKILDASNISLQTKSGAEVESTEIALAFPLKNQGKKNSVQVMPPKQPVFAFLPLRSYGFRFIIQGDFDVPSSREDVDRDSSWNQWLRNEIPTVFIDTLEIFKTHSEFSSMEAVCAFLQFVPMEDEVLEFFKPVASDILKKLKAKPCIPTQPKKQGMISWRIPSQTVRVRDPLVRNVITADLLETHLNLFYLHSDIASVLNPALTSCLGIETMTSDHLFQLGKALIINMGTHCSKDEDVILISKWMACLYRSLDEFQHDDTILPTLKLHRFLPLSDGELVSLQEKTVFHPIPNSSTKRQKGKDPMYYLQQDVNSLHPLLLNTGDNEVNSQVHKLLLRLGVKQLSPSDVINYHIIPVLKSDAWQAKSKGTLVSYIVYIKEQTDKQASVCSIEEVKDVAMVMTNKGFKSPSREPVQFPMQYGNQVNLQDVFKGYDWTLLDPCYLPHTCTQPIITSWQEFFRKLGVEDFLSIRKKDVHIKKDELADSYWESRSLVWPKDEPVYIVQDYYSVELEGLIKNNKYSSGEHFEKQMRHLCIHLDRSWDIRFSKYCKTHVVDKDGNILKETDTSFSILLQTSRWLPAEEVEITDVNGHLMRDVRIVMKEPNSLYLKSSKIQNLLSDKVLYLDLNLSGGSFHQFLGLKNYVTLETVKSYLLQWCERTKNDLPAKFYTSLEHMKYVYAYLGGELKKQEIQDLLRKHPVFFVPDTVSPYAVNAEEIIIGKMLSRNEIWLMDRTGLFDKHRPVLDDFHSDLSLKRTIVGFYHDRPDIIELFRQEGKIDTQPKVEEYIELLCLLCSSNSPKDTIILSDVLFIFTIIGQILVTSPEGMPDEQTANMAQEAMKATVKKKLQREKVFPTKRQVWVSLEDHPMIPDNREWEKMFADEEGVHFLDMEDKSDGAKRTIRGGVIQRGHRNKSLESRIQPEMIDVVIKVCEIKKLSESVDIKPTPEWIEPCLQFQAYFSDIVPSVQQYLMVRFDEIYQQLEMINTKEMLAEAKFYQTSKLEVSYWLDNMSKPVIQQEKCVIHPPEFYFHREHLTAVGEINREIARYFSRGNTGCSASLRSFLSELSTIVSGETEDTLDELLQRHEADGIEIPDDEQWVVEAPVLPEPDLPEEEEQVLSDEEQESELNITKQEGELELRAWPPVANAGKTQHKEPTERPSSNIWPPPQAKDYMKSVKDLPANIRMVVPSQDTTKVCVDKGVKVGGEKDSNEVSEFVGAGKRLNTYTVQSSDSKLPVEQLDKTSAEKSAEGQPLESSEHSEGISTEMMNNNALVQNLEQGKTDIPERKSDSIPEINEQHSRDADTRDYHGKDKNNSALYEQDQQQDTQRYAGVTRHHKTGGRYHFSRGQPIIKGDPVWTFMATDYIYDDLGSGKDLGIIDSLTLCEGAGGPEIGQWGEALVAQYLQRQKELGNIVQFSWKNSEEETGCPFDFEIQLAGKSGIISNYIEVKSTLSEDKEVFEISLQQIQFADQEKENFHIYRVFNAGNPERVKLIRITNLDMRLAKKQVKLCMLI